MGDRPDLVRGLTEYLTGLLEERRDLQRLEALMQTNDDRRAVLESLTRVNREINAGRSHLLRLQHQAALQTQQFLTPPAHQAPIPRPQQLPQTGQTYGISGQNGMQQGSVRQRLTAAAPNQNHFPGNRAVQRQDVQHVTARQPPSDGHQAADRKIVPQTLIELPMPSNINRRQMPASDLNGRQDLEEMMPLASTRRHDQASTAQNAHTPANQQQLPIPRGQTASLMPPNGMPAAPNSTITTAGLRNVGPASPVGANNPATGEIRTEVERRARPQPSHGRSITLSPSQERSTTTRTSPPTSPLVEHGDAGDSDFKPENEHEDADVIPRPRALEEDYDDDQPKPASHDGVQGRKRGRSISWEDEDHLCRDVEFKIHKHTRSHKGIRKSRATNNEAVNTLDQDEEAENESHSTRERFERFSDNPKYCTVYRDNETGDVFEAECPFCKGNAFPGTTMSKDGELCTSLKRLQSHIGSVHSDHHHASDGESASFPRRTYEWIALHRRRTLTQGDIDKVREGTYVVTGSTLNRQNRSS
ncbi:hypothetical protein PRZ48_010219 [Zasmidium cellare]|uniref:Uncharacterized protein n=1 Tax=Zasmidium cellare TaxID=395010 RepID=A0ABR0EEL6_ZASCE|nr:hypothetical protein PRZ48_010219 [Zasmidium cellare]